MIRSQTEITVRQFRSEDQTAAKSLILAGIEERFGRLDLSLNPDLDDIEASYSEGIFLVAESEGGLVGTGALVREGEGIGRIVRMWVRSDLRRSGIGSMILECLNDYAHNLSCKQLVLETTSTWTDAQGFYRKHGFVITGHDERDTHLSLDLLCVKKFAQALYDSTEKTSG